MLGAVARSFAFERLAAHSTGFNDSVRYLMNEVTKQASKLAKSWVPCRGLRLLPSLTYLAAACERLEGVAEWLATPGKPSQGYKLIQAVAKGCGGGLDNFSSVIVRHIELINRRASQPDVALERIAFFLESVLTFLINAEIRDTPVFRALCNHGFVAALTFAAASVEVLEPVGMGVNSNDGYTRVMEALQAGLLQVIITGCDNSRTCLALQSLETILATALPASTVHDSVVVQIQASLREIGVFTPSTRRSYGSQECCLCVNRSLHWGDTGSNFSTGSTPANSNLAKDVIMWSAVKSSKIPKNSKPSIGRPAVIVNSVPVFVISVFPPGDDEQGVTARDRSFMRILVHQQYIAAKEEILLRQMEFFSKNPRDPYLVVFNYIHGVGNIEVVPSTDVIGAKNLELTNFAWLQERSAGRIEPYAMVTLSGPRIIPLRSTSGRVREESVKRIARSVDPEGFDLERCPSNIRDEIKPLVKEKNTKVVQIH
ncbi:hypothetical protein B0H17DRAFT_1145183 [Mycena rosella]|uniref:Uncharacterized protein n=1 Tax=Mycena rosella TaxID=1033263 RepID=A0AAD7G224_MYCRO|nr:hypothetical protein B0H17DRAFT_1145183 [Mycena rosella]